MQERDISINIVAHLRHGRENAKDRFQLQNETGLPDRVNRKLIERERKAGTPIISLPSGAGYYISTDPMEIKRFQKQEVERRNSIDGNIQGMQIALERLEAR